MQGDNVVRPGQAFAVISGELVFDDYSGERPVLGVAQDEDSVGEQLCGSRIAEVGVVDGDGVVVAIEFKVRR